MFLQGAETIGKIKPLTAAISPFDNNWTPIQTPDFAGAKQEYS